MAGDRQTPSGTDFDPCPQFWVNEIDHLRPLTLTGQCWFAPVRIGTIFDQFTPADGHDPPEPCCLRVEVIQIYGQLVDELDQVLSAADLERRRSGRPGFEIGVAFHAEPCGELGGW
jgi:hypothetical protein